MMKTRIHLTLILLVMLALLLTTPSLAQDSPSSEVLVVNDASASSSATAPWFFSTVDTDPPNDVGQHVSIAFHPVSDRPYISYYDAYNQNLQMAKYVITGGNCGPDNTWSCETVDMDTGHVGTYSSIAFDPTDNLPVISYFDASNGALKLAERMANHWGFTIIHDPNFVSGGRYTSLKLDAAGKPHISFYVSNFLGDDHMWYAKYVGGSAGDCSNPNYECEQIAYTGEGRGKYTSLALDSNDKPRIAFWDESHNRLGYAWNNGTWTFLYVSDPDGGAAGKFASLAVDVNNADRPHIAHYDNINGILEYTTYVGTGGNCESLGNPVVGWQCDDIDDIGISTDPKGISIAVDGAGYPIIAYQSGGAVLKVARPATAMGLLVGNCGPANPTFTWQCEVISIGFGIGQGDYMSLALNSAGLGTIAYHGSVSGGMGNLRVAYQRFETFLPLVLKNQN